MDVGMYVSVVGALSVVSLEEFLCTCMVLAYAAMGASCHLCVCESVCVLSVSVSAEHLTINRNQPSRRGLRGSTFSHPDNNDGF